MHLRHRLARGVRQDGPEPAPRPAGRARAPAARPGRAAVQAQRPRFPPRHLPRARRLDRDLPRASGGPRLAPVAVRRRDRGDRRVRSADRRAHRHARARQALPEQPLRDPQADAERGGGRDQGRAEGAARRVAPGPAPARGRAPGAAHHRRSGDDRHDRILPRDRELLALPDRPAPGRAAADPVRVPARQRAPDRRREPHLGAPAARHVPRRLPAQVHARRVRLPPAVVHRQPALEVRGMGRDAAADRVRLGHARPLGAGADRRRVRRAGDPADRPDRPRVPGAPGRIPGRRPDGRVPRVRRARPARAGHHA